MNNRYLYKAKRKDNGEWVEGIPIKTHIGLFISFEENPHYCSQYGYMEIDEIIIVDENTLCQCTGKRDNTRTKEFPEGKLIFEHDIVAFLDTYSTESGRTEQECIGEVLWDDKDLCFYVTERLSAESYEVLDDCKVIGSIFDNPELLEGV